MVRLFSHYFPSNILLQVALDATLLFAAILLGAVVENQGSHAVVNAAMLPAVVFALFMTLLISALGLYRHDQPRSFGGAARRILLAFALGLPILYGIFEYLPCTGACQKPLFVSNGILALAGILLLRAAYLNSVDSGIFSRRILVLGASAEAAAVEQALTAPGIPGLTLVGFYPIDTNEISVSRHRLLPNDQAITDAVSQLRVDEVIVAVRERRGGVLPLNQLLNCKLEGVSVIDLSTFFERIHGEVRIESLRASWLIYGEGFRQGALRMLVKRTSDLVAALILLAVSLPVILMAAIAIRLESRGPILYRQERVGRAGKVFKVMKFRSMYTDAEADGKPRWAKANDSRVTRVGRIIRRTRIDELPQILNVLVGDMSLVGPRPERPFFVSQLSQQIPFYGARHSVKPGITGWAQVRYKYGATVDDAVHKLQFDLYYIKNHTLFLDLVILFKTISVVLSGEGAH